MSVPDRIKGIAAAAAVSTMPRLRFENCVFVLSHMRSVSTALTQVLASHPDIWGYGETHVSYVNQPAPCRLWLNLLRHQRTGLRRGLLLDKVLHNALDANVAPDFYRSKAIFLLRSPAPTIRSILALSKAQGLNDWQTPDLAARYYLGRVSQMLDHWHMFAPSNRMGLLSEALTTDPDAALASLSRFLPISSSLENRYGPAKSKLRHGAGDPMKSQSMTRIEPTPATVDLSPPEGVTRSLAQECVQAYLMASDLLVAADTGSSLRD